MTTAIFSHHACLRHQVGDVVPETPLRITTIQDHLIAQGVDYYFDHQQAGMATIEHIKTIHDPEYVDKVIACSPPKGAVHMFAPDLAISSDTITAALYAAGACISAADFVCDASDGSNAFVLVRPPGHHATPNSGMGFCVFNNVAICANQLFKKGLRKIAIVDFDVHHGNGTEEFFRNNPSVLMTGFFQHPFYPYSGYESDSPNMVNVPLPAGADGEVVREIFAEICLPAIEEHQPDAILISAGFDAHYEDDMGQMRLTESDYSWITSKLVAMSKKVCQGRIISILEGGYDISALSRSVCSHLTALAELD